MTDRTYQVIIGVLVLIIVVGGSMALGVRRSATSGTDEQTNAMADADLADAKGASSASPAVSSGASMQADVVATPSTSVTTAQGDAVSVVDQSAGEGVMVKSATLTKLGWVAVRDTKGWTLGAARVAAGTQADINVPLLRATEAGQTYEVVLYADDGDGAFDIHKDSIVMKADGSALSAAFLAK